MKAKELVIFKLKTVIKKKYKTIKDFSKDFGINESQMNKYLRGENSIGIEILEKISEHLNISISYFFNDEINSEILDTKLFNEIFFLAYQLALENKIEINGTYFLACYDLIATDVRKSNIDIETSFKNNKKIILKFVTKN